ncbi:MAG: ethanolamine ammonia-lyase subunit EutB [Oligoflexus sp.]|nr:ethanolamine ammonia-lyase subunit EutB [Oligoflexus sp.]
MAKASPRRGADKLAGLAAKSEVERVAAQICLANLPLKTFLNETLIPYESEDVTRLTLSVVGLEMEEPRDASEFLPPKIVETPS